MQHHGHQMQPRQVLPVQPLPPRDRAHPVPPLMGQQPKSSPSQPLPQQSSNQPPPQKLTQRTQSSQQASQPTKQQMAAHPQTSMQDNIQQGGPPGQRVANRPDTHPVNSSGLDRIPPKQESTIDQNVGRQLKVEDALAYLEQVKSQFSDRPSVYNNFLDIMKEFKAQTIDTAEVIRRVSSLFQGHRKLILGFNTFLPPGFRIELRGDPTKGCVTGFSSPGGVFFPLNGEELPPQPVPPLQRQPDMPPPQPSPMSIDASQHPPPQQHGPALPRHQAYPPSRDGHRPNQMAHPEAGFDQGAYHKPVVETEEKPQVATSVAPTQASPAISLVNNSKIKAQPVVSSNDNAAAALAGAFASPSTSAVVPGKPIEFEQAVTYVNKIKSRFSEDEDVYQTFLRILQTYQKDQKSIKEVQKQVSSLFQDHNDLLAGFSHFLPEQAPQLQRPNSSHTAADATSGRGRPQSSHVKQQPVLEGVVADGSSFPSSNWRGKDRPGKVPSSGRSKSGKSTVMTLGTNGGVAKSGSSARQKSSSAQDPKRIRRSASSGKKTSNDIKFGQLPPAMAGTAMVAGEAPTPELEFFEELRSQLGPEGQQSYSDFIKCLSLFSQEIICEDELMRLADGLLNNRKPLTDAFRAFLDQSDRKAAESAVFILRKAKSSGEGSSANGVAGKGHAAPPGINTQAVAENLKDLPLLTGISGPGSTGFNGGNKSPKINPLYSGKPLSEIGREYGTEIAESSSYMALPSDLGAIPCSGMSGKDRDVLNHMCISRGNVTGVPLIEYDQGPQPPNGSARRKAISRQHPPVTGRAGQGGSCGLTGNGSGSPRTVQNGYGVVTPLSIEDQRVELALIISQAENTIGKLERFRKGEIRSITSLSSLDLKPIELIYKDASCDILEVLRSNPVVTVPVIFERLEQRLLEWQVSRKKLERIWKSKRFCRKNEVIDAPRTWRRGELVGELKMLHEGLSLSKKEHKCDKGVNSEKGRKEKNMDNEDSECGKQADVGQSDKDTSKNDNYCGKDVDAGKEKKSVIGPRSKSMQRFLICEDKNLSLICDILWYAFEWEANCAEEADQGLEFLERTYYVLQKLEEDENRFYMDEHLYVYIRLISEASVRVNYVLEQRSERIEKLINGVKDVLGGMISLPMYDEICMKLFGESDEWEEVLGDLPLIFKRLAGSARKIWQRRNAKELLKLAEINVLGKGKAGKNDDGDVNMTEAAAGVSKEESENSSKRLRKAIMLTGETNGEVIEMQIEVESEVCKEDEVEEQTGLRNGGKRLVLSMRYVPRGTASQYERFNVKEEKVGYKDFDSALTKYIRRAVKRKRHRGYIETSGKDTAMDMIQVDGLDVRVDEEDGELRYVSGTEDFLVKAAFKRRRKMTRLSDLVQHQRQRSAVVVTMS